MDPGERACRKSLACAISIDGRKDWIWSTACTRWRCRRYYHDIPAGSCGKYRQAIAARTGEWFTGSSTSSEEEDRKSKDWRQKIRSIGPGLRPWKRREGKEPKEGKAFHPGESGMEEEW